MTPRACPACRWSRGVDCERPDALPAAWLAANEVAGVLVPGADGCPGWERPFGRPRSAMGDRLLRLVELDPGRPSQVYADRLSVSKSYIVKLAGRLGLVNPHGLRSARTCWYPPRDAPDLPELPSPIADGEPQPGAGPAGGDTSSASSSESGGSSATVAGDLVFEGFEEYGVDGQTPHRQPPDLRAAFARLREVSAGAWDDVDPRAFVDELRGGADRFTEDDASPVAVTQRVPLRLALSGWLDGLAPSVRAALSEHDRLALLAIGAPDAP